MTFDDLQNLTAYWLDDLNFGYFTPVQVKLWLNNAQKEVQKILLQSKVNFYLTPVQTTLVVNQSDYVLPSDFVTLHRGEVVIDGTPPNESTFPVKPITLNQQDMAPSGVGTPRFYFLKKNRIKFFPAPDTAKVFRMHYSYGVSDMVLGTDLPDIPDPYHELVSVLATLDGLLKDGRDTNPMLVKKKYYIDLLKEETQERNEDAPRSVVYTGDDSSEVFGYF